MPDPKQPDVLIGIKNITYNKNLRLLETILIDNSKGPDISLDAFMAKDSSIKEFKEKANEVATLLTQQQERFNKANEEGTEIKTQYNQGIEEMAKIVESIERMVTT